LIEKHLECWNDFRKGNKEERKNDFDNAWENSLRNQIKELPDFNQVYSKVISEVQKYETN